MPRAGHTIFRFLEEMSLCVGQGPRPLLEQHPDVAGNDGQGRPEFVDGQRQQFRPARIRGRIQHLYRLYVVRAWNSWRICGFQPDEPGCTSTGGTSATPAVFISQERGWLGPCYIDTETLGASSASNRRPDTAC